MTLGITLALVLFVVGTTLLYVGIRESKSLAFTGVFALVGAVFFVNQATQVDVVANTCVAGVQEVHPEWPEMSNGALLDAVGALNRP